MKESAGYVKGVVLVLSGLICVALQLADNHQGGLIAGAIFIVGGFYAPTLSAIRIALEKNQNNGG